MNTRPGFSLIETIVALLLLQVGMLALAATAGVAARDYADAITRRRALAAVERRAESLRSRACRSAGSGTLQLANGGTETWSTSGSGAAREVVARLTVPMARGRRATVESRGWVLCGE